MAYAGKVAAFFSPAGYAIVLWAKVMDELVHTWVHDGETVAFSRLAWPHAGERAWL